MLVIPSSMRPSPGSLVPARFDTLDRAGRGCVTLARHTRIIRTGISHVSRATFAERNTSISKRRNRRCFRSWPECRSRAKPEYLDLRSGRSAKLLRVRRLGAADELVAALQLVDVLKPYKAAAREITGWTSYEKIATKLLSLGPKVVAVTMGSERSLLARGGEMKHVPAFQVKVVDSNGAGDAFMGGLSFGLLRGWDLQTAGLFANACAAICCSRVGARAMGYLEEVTSLANRQRPGQRLRFTVRHGFSSGRSALSLLRGGGREIGSTCRLLP